MRRTRLCPTSSEGSSKFYDSPDEKQASVGISHRKSLSNGNVQCDRENNFASVDTSNSKIFDTSSNLDITLVDGDQTIIENGSRTQTKPAETSSPESQYVTVSPTKLSKPPPLPPKPKSLLMTNALKTNHVITAKPYPRTVQNSPSPPTESRESKHIF